jgi:CBS domain-containing protein
MLKLRDIMTTDVVTVSPDTTVRDAMELLATRHVSGAPVMSGTELVGVVTAGDLLTFAASAPGSPTERSDQTEWGTEAEESPDSDEALEKEDDPNGAFFTEMWDDAGAEVTERAATVESPEWSVLDEHDVSEVMTRKLWTLGPDEPVDKAADVMRSASIHRVLVTEAGKLVGIVSAIDIAGAVADHKLSRRTYVFNRDRDFGKAWS